jgi:two-component system phosphate regulon sensor histidine kinase PhoR
VTAAVSQLSRRLTLEPDKKIAGRVLAIDDEAPVVETIARMLAIEGYEVDTALSGKDGIDLFKQKPYDMVLTDLRLGDLSGTDVLREVKAIHPQTSVIILTGYATTESAVEAIKLGASDYLTKPVRMSELMMSVRNQMSAVQLNSQINVLNKAVEEERDKLGRSLAELTLIKRLASRMMSALSYFDGLELILNFLVEEVKADVAVIYDLERRIGRLGAGSSANKNETVQLCDLINSRCKELSATANCSAESFEGGDKSASGDGASALKSFLSVPIYQEGRLFGLLVAGSRSDEKFGEKWGTFANQISQEASEFLSRVKRSVEAQQHWTSAIVEHTLDGLVVADIDKGQVLVNPVARSFLEIPLGKEPTQEMIEFKLGFRLADAQKEVKELSSKDNPRSTLVKHSDLVWRGQQVFVRLNISLLPGTGKTERSGLLIVMHDVTQERVVEEMKAKLMSNISHELRTPTAVLKEFISLILDGVAGELTSSQRQYIQIMQSNVERLSRLIENLLTLARSDSGGFSVILQPVDVVPLVETVVQSLTPKLAKKGMEISFDLPKDLPKVYADRDAVTQILTNLVENARKYSPENTDVTISTKVKGSRIEVAVTDQGYGIPAGEHEAIFKRFHRLVDKDDPRFQEGVGLGLSLVKDLVTRHGGDIWLTSEVGKGSTFYFSLQIADEEDEKRQFKRA